MIRTSLVALGLLLAVTFVPQRASAQVFGTFPWQMQPYCNIVTLTLTATPAGGFTLDGSDDQCGATNRAGAVGVATFNGGGSVTINFTIVTAPSGKPVHVSAVVSPATGSGTWNDSAGNTGTFAFFGNVPALPARPTPTSGLAAASVTSVELAAGAVGAAQINQTQVQARVTGTCPAGQAVSGINANGTVTCTATDANVQFRVEGKTSALSLPDGVRVDLTNWNTVTFNTGGGTYTPAAGTYTVPSSGLYVISATSATSNVAGPGAGTYRFITVEVNGNVAQQSADEASDSFQELQVVCIRNLNAGDVVNISMIHNLGAGVTTGNSSAGDSHFAVVKLR